MPLVTLPAATPAAAEAVLLPRHEGEQPLPLARLSVATYLQMLATGCWGDQAPELLGGVLLEEQVPADAPYVYLVETLSDLIDERLPDGWYSREEKSFELPESVVAPDLAIVRGSRRDYAQRLPRGENAAVLIEVAVTSQARDRRKAAYYAEAGVPQYVLVDVAARAVTQYQQPTPEGYEQIAGVDAIELTIDEQPLSPIVVADLFAALPTTS